MFTIGKPVVSKMNYAHTKHLNDQTLTWKYRDGILIATVTIVPYGYISGLVFHQLTTIVDESTIFHLPSEDYLRGKKMK